MSNMNVSHISTNSLNSRTGDYSRIGFERTASIHFDDLKDEQANIRGKVTSLRKQFASLKAREEKWEKRKKLLEDEKAEKEAKKAGGMDVSSLWAVTDDDIEEEINLETAMIDFNQARQDAISLVKEWEQLSANQIAIYPGKDKADRKKSLRLRQFNEASHQNDVDNGHGGGGGGDRGMVEDQNESSGGTARSS